MIYTFTSKLEKLNLQKLFYLQLQTSVMSTMADATTFACLHLQEGSAHAQTGSFSTMMEKRVKVL